MTDRDIGIYVRSEKEETINLTDDIKLVICTSPGDGSCFYHSVLFAIKKRDYISTNNKEGYVEALRNAVADYYVEDVEEDNFEEIKKKLEKSGFEVRGDHQLTATVNNDEMEIKMVRVRNEFSEKSRLLQDVDFMSFSANMMMIPSKMDFDAGKVIKYLRSYGVFACDITMSKVIDFLKISLLIIERRRKKLTANLYTGKKESDKFIIIFKTGAHYDSVFPKIGEYYYDFVDGAIARKIETLLK